MQLLVMRKFPEYLCFPQSHVTVYRHMLVGVIPELFGRSNNYCYLPVMSELMEHTGNSYGYNGGYNKSKPVNPRHDTWLLKLKRWYAERVQ
ncbi:hypothetical protein pVco7_gp045 [Vibrio phage pVco-7]|uniref:Uncharacterized protein n=1 Tax=Vibrio phage pVco-5 TaxID=1965485 RepID=A0A1W6JUT1_9CAUD|nr:hypothetical protein KNT61_gp046 [Vibrio phage pVco-5]ARM71034.1 hypothetical protein pVco5_046 [Vibrio phage pVco-5]